MRNYFYFIENANNEWYYIDKRIKKDLNPLNIDTTIYHYDEWTNDPLQAMRFKSEQNAKDYIKVFSKEKELAPYTITEHEFIVNKV